MGNKLYVGNLPYSVRDSDLEQAFGQFGAVTSAKVADGARHRPLKGFGLWKWPAMPSASCHQRHEWSALGGRSIVVNEARPMEPRPHALAASAAAVVFSGGRSGGGYGGGREGGGAVAVTVAAAVKAAAMVAVAKAAWGLWRRQAVAMAATAVAVVTVASAALRLRPRNGGRNGGGGYGGGNGGGY